MTAKIKKLFLNRNRNYVLLGQIIGAILALISGKLIATFIIPADFGKYNLQFAAYTFFATLLLSPFLQYIKASNNTLLPRIGHKYFVFTVGVLGVLTYVLIIGFMYFYYGSIDLALYGILLLFLPLSVLNSTLGDYLNTTNQLVTSSKFGVLNKFSSLIFLAIFFAAGWSFVDHSQVLWIMQTVGIVVALFVFISKYKYLKAKVEIAYSTFFKRYINFAGPLMFLALWAWINNYFDRFAIEYFLSVKDVGIYNASYSVGSKFFLLISPIFMILLTPKVYANKAKVYRIKSISRSVSVYFILAIPVLGIIYILKNYIGNILLSEEYEEGFFLIFWISLAYFIFTMTQLLELVFYTESKTGYILWSNVVSAIINIILNLLLIPKIGLFGAAIATTIGFAFHFFVTYYFYQKI